MKIGLYWRYATRSLLRGGQRTVLGLFCIAVGVMAIVALQLVGQSINGALTGNIAAVNGGDLKVTTSVRSAFTDKDLTFFDGEKSAGKIAQYAESYTLNGLFTTDSGDITTFDVVAVTSGYPLVGQPAFITPSSTSSLQNVLTGKNVAVNERVLKDLNAHIGDSLTVQTGDGRAVPVTITAEFSNTGAFRGDQMYINFDTLTQAPGPNGVLARQYDTIYTLIPSGGNVNQVKTDVAQKFPNATITTVADQLKSRQDQVKQFRLFLQIVGLLALFIGGIGIINTMQVLLRRRRVEIAMLKTSGYVQTDLYSMFGLEAGLLGLVGGIVGTLMGIGASYAVGLAVGNSFHLQLPINLDPLTLASGVMIGFFTALIFGLLPIVQASQVRPLSVLRESEEAGGTSWILTAGLLALLSVLFVLLATTILGDFVQAAFAVYGGGLALVGLALGFGVLVVAISKLPVYEKPTPKVLLWILAGFGGVIGAGIVFALLSLLGGLSLAIATNGLKNASLGAYAIAVFGGLGLVLFGGSLVYFMATLVSGIVMFLPRAAKTAVMFAYRNMGRQRLRTTTTLTALFVGVFAIGIVVVLGQGIKDTLNTSLATLITRNVFIFSPPGLADQLKSDVTTQKGVTGSTYVANLIASQVVPVSVNGQDLQTIIANDPVKGFATQNGTVGKELIFTLLSSIQGYNLSSAQKADQPDLSKTANPQTLVDGRNLTAADAGTGNIIVSSTLKKAPTNLRVDSTIVLASQDGKTNQTLTVVGFYDGNGFIVSQGSIYADNTITQSLGGASLINAAQVKVNPDDFKALRKQLKQAFGAQVVPYSIGDITGIVNDIFNNIIVMLTAIASLAMIAGLIIIANAVALAMLERRREIGILKSVGHTSQSVLATVMLENGLVGLLGSLVAMALVGGALTLLSTFVFHTTINLGGGLILLIIGATTVVTMGIAGIVAWDAARLRPIEVLRYE